MKKFKEKTIIMDSEQMDRVMKRIAHEVMEKNKKLKDSIVLGIKTRGVPLAERLVKYINEMHGIILPINVLDISLYRDDLTALSEKPIINQTIISSSIQGKTVILVDDVLYTGRTIRAALDSIIDMGRPSSIQLIVMIDRGHKELPIRADYVGKNVPTSKREKIDVMLREIDGEDKVVIKEQEEE